MGLNTYSVAVRDRLTGVLVAAVAVAVMLWFTLAVYSDLDLSFYYDNMPPSLLESFGISTEAGGLGGLAYGAMYNLIGALALAGLAIAIGAASIAGEEQRGTLGLLLANPRSRSRVLAAKLAALVTLVGAGALLLYAAGHLVPRLMDIDIGGLHVGALMLHLGANALLWGMLALAVGAWTGQPGLASGSAAGLMVLSYLGSSVLPLLDGGDTAAKMLPWTWFTETAPEVNGVSTGYLALQLGACAALAAIAFVGLRRRDLRSGGSMTTLMDRLRANPRTHALVERVSGQARVSSITTKTVSDHQVLTTIVSALALYIAILMPPFYTFLPGEVSEFFAQLPDAMIAMVGGVDMGTATGFLQGEVFSITVPIALIVLTATVGAHALAGEEEARTMGLLLANAIPRRAVVLHKAASMVILAAVVGLVTFLGSTAGVLLSGVDVAVADLAATCVLVTLLGLDFGALAMLVSAATGRVRAATSAAAGAAGAAYVLQTFLPLSDRYDQWAAVSPFHYYLGSDPLTTGMPWGDAAVLAGAFVVLVALAVPAFQRRDLRG